MPIASIIVGVLIGLLVLLAIALRPPFPVLSVVNSYGTQAAVPPTTATHLYFPLGPIFKRYASLYDEPWDV